MRSHSPPRRHIGHVERSTHMHGTGVSDCQCVHGPSRMGHTTARRTVRHPFRRSTRPPAHGALRTEERAHRDRGLRDRGGLRRCARPARAIGPHRRPDALELRAARHHRRRAAEVPPNAARADRLSGDQSRAAAAATGTASAVHRSGRTVDRARDHIASLRTRPPRRAGRPGARPHGLASRLAVAARLQGRRVRRRTGSVRRLPGRSRHVPVPRGREP